MHTRVLKFNSIFKEHPLVNPRVSITIQKYVYLPAFEQSPTTSMNQVDQNGDSSLVGLSAHKKAQYFSLKVPNHHKLTNKVICLFFIYMYIHIHTYIKSLLCKIFQSWGLKRQHSSQLSAVHFLHSRHSLVFCGNLTWMFLQRGALKLPCFWSRCVAVQTPQSHQ